MTDTKDNKHPEGYPCATAECFEPVQVSPRLKKYVEAINRASARLKKKRRKKLILKCLEAIRKRRGK